MKKDKLYNIFINLITTLKIEELKKLTQSITEYIENDL